VWPRPAIPRAGSKGLRCTTRGGPAAPGAPGTCCVNITMVAVHLGFAELQKRGPGRCRMILKVALHTPYDLSRVRIAVVISIAASTSFDRRPEAVVKARRLRRYF
jgi:hypothetical protein